MKTAALLILSLGCLTFSAFSEPKVSNPTEWYPIKGLDTASHAAFIDLNSTSRVRGDDNTDFSSAAILIVYKQGNTVEYQEKILKSKSMVRHVFMDCKAAMFSPTVEFHFDINMPTRNDKPIAAFKYNSAPESFVAVSKSSTMYKVFCPNYV